MAQHKQDLEKTLQSAWSHKEAGSKVAVTTIAIEAMVGIGLATTEMVKNTDARETRRLIAAASHRPFGQRLADAVVTMDKIIEDEGLTIEAEDTEIDGQHNQKLRKTLESATALKATGVRLADMVDKADKAVDALLVEYGAGGAKEDAGVEADLIVIRTALDAAK